MKSLNPPYRRSGWLFTAVGLLSLAAFSARADYQSTVLADKPIAYFALDLTVDNGGTATDLSGNGNSSAYYNIYPVSGPTAFLPNAAFFTGDPNIQSYVDLSTGGNTSILDFGGTISIEAWVQSTNLTQVPADIMAQGYDGNQNGNENCLRANGGNYYGGSFAFTNGDGNVSGGTGKTNRTPNVTPYSRPNWTTL